MGRTRKVSHLPENLVVKEVLPYHDSTSKFGLVVTEVWPTRATVITELGYQVVRNYAPTLKGPNSSCRDILGGALSGSHPIKWVNLAFLIISGCLCMTRWGLSGWCGDRELTSTGWNYFCLGSQGPGISGSVISHGGRCSTTVWGG